MISPAARLDRVSKIAAFTGIAAMALLWLAALTLLPVPQDFSDPWSRLGYAAGWIAVVALFGLNMAVEAVAHERFQGDAFDPLAGHETERLRVNQRYLQNTVEQFILFSFGLIGLALDGAGGGRLSVRIITASAIVWIISRYLFWLGYHRNSGLRVIGIFGLAQSMLVLVWLVCRFAERHWGLIGLVAPLVALAVIEAVLVLKTRGRQP